jgi:hypothetical protein
MTAKKIKDHLEHQFPLKLSYNKVWEGRQQCTRRNAWHFGRYLQDVVEIQSRVRSYLSWKHNRD